MKIVIIGGGPASVEASVAFRKRDGESSIVLCSAETVAPYRRPALSRMIAETLPDSSFYQKKESFYKEQSIDLRLGCRAEVVDRANRKVFFADGSSEAYDRLLLATGGASVVPDIPGATLPCCGVLREKNDLDALKRRLHPDTHVVVGGGGLLGLEAADALLRAGCRVTVLEVCQVLLPRQLDAHCAKLLHERWKSIPNLDLRLNECIKSITGDCSVDAVRLGSGDTLACDFVLFSMGARPRVELAQHAGLDVGRGIKVDASMRTSDDAIYAAGDCAEFQGRVSGLYSPARSQGTVAGDCMAGGDAIYVPEETAARLSVFGTVLQSSGDITGEGRDESEGGKIRRVFYRNNKVVGQITLQFS